MKTILNLLGAVPKGLRFAVVVVLAGLSFWQGAEGLTDGSIVVGSIFTVIFALLAYTLYYMMNNKSQL